MKKIIAAAFAVAVALTACTPQSGPEPAPSASPSASVVELTDKQKHIVEDAQKALEREPYSEQGLKDFIIADEGYSEADVTAAVNSIACDIDWAAQAEKKAATYGLTDKEAIKSRLLDDGFTEEEAQLGAYPIQQNT